MSDFGYEEGISNQNAMTSQAIRANAMSQDIRKRTIDELQRTLNTNLSTLNQQERNDEVVSGSRDLFTVGNDAGQFYSMYQDINKAGGFKAYLRGAGAGDRLSAIAGGINKGLTGVGSGISDLRNNIAESNVGQAVRGGGGRVVATGRPAQTALTQDQIDRAETARVQSDPNRPGAPRAVTQTREETIRQLGGDLPREDEGFLRAQATEVPITAQERLNRDPDVMALQQRVDTLRAQTREETIRQLGGDLPREDEGFLRAQNANLPITTPQENSTTAPITAQVQNPARDEAQGINRPPANESVQEGTEGARSSVAGSGAPAVEDTEATVSDSDKLAQRLNQGLDKINQATDTISTVNKIAGTAMGITSGITDIVKITDGDYKKMNGWDKASDIAGIVGGGIDAVSLALPFLAPLGAVASGIEAITGTVGEIKDVTDQKKADQNGESQAEDTANALAQSTQVSPILTSSGLVASRTMDNTAQIRPSSSF
jgi:hypothetical protein